MPDERLINQIENILGKITTLGGKRERTSMVPNLTVIDAAPTGLDGFVIVSDDRDGDNILAKKVGSIIYTNGDKINTLFVEGTEAVAFQQGSESPSSGNIWGIVPSTSTDIFYNKGDVGIGKSVAPDAALEILNTSQAQLRLTHTEDTKFVDFTLDTNHDLTITPSSTGQIILQPTSDSVDFFQVLDADGGTPVLNVDSTNERVGVGTAAPDSQFHVQNVTGVAMTVERATANGVPSLEFKNDATNYRFQIRGDSSDEFTIRAGGGGGTIPFKLFDTSPTNSFVIASDGTVGVGQLVPAARLHVDQSSTTAAIPVLYLDQADVSEEMIQFESTIGVGNAIESVGGKALTITHYIKVTLPGALTRYIAVGTIA